MDFVSIKREFLLFNKKMYFQKKLRRKNKFERKKRGKIEREKEGESSERRAKKKKKQMHISIFYDQVPIGVSFFITICDNM